MKKYITFDQLKHLNACQEELKRFRIFFGREVLLTKKVIDTYYYKFDFAWAARNLLYQKDYKKWVTLYNRNNDKIADKKLTEEQAVKSEAILFWRLYKGPKQLYRRMEDKT